MTEQGGEVSQLLRRLNDGDKRASSQLFRMVHAELRSIAGRFMRNERAGHDLQATALVNEAYLRLFGGSKIQIEGSEHLFRIMARAMRNILIDHARKLRAGKREGLQVTLSTGLAGRDVDATETAALCLAIRRLAKQDERAARIVDLHYFSGWTIEDISKSLGVNRRTVERDLLAPSSF